MLHVSQLARLNETAQSIVPPSRRASLHAYKSHFDNLGKQLGITQLSDWYKFGTKELYQLKGGRALLKKFEFSIYKALKEIYPEFNWEAWKFSKLPQHYLKDNRNQKEYFDWIACQLGIKEPADWYKFNLADISKQFGRKEFSPSNDTLYSVLRSVYPEYNWVPWKFSKVSNAFWKDTNNLRQYFDWMGAQLGVKELPDWYKVTVPRIKSEFGLKALAMYRGSLHSTLKSVYPEFQWEATKFVNAPRNYWKNPANVKQYLESLVKDEASVQQGDYFSKMLWEAMHASKRSSILRNFKGYSTIFHLAFPQEVESASKLLPSRPQIDMYNMITKLFPKEQVHMEYVHPEMKYRTSLRNMIFDVFVPSLSLAIEYQGVQHYGMHYLYGSPTRQQFRDQQKQQECSDRGVTLIEIPYWWDGKLTSLIATLRRRRPDLVLADVPLS